MMRSFDPAMAGKNLDELGIYDPWYGQMRDFEYTTELIDTAARALIAGLAAEGDAA
jgi:phosphotyrosine protein phosphatase